MAEILNKKDARLSQPLVPVLLAGGQGSRLWPLSTPSRPKQFLSLNSAYSLFQDTLLRVFDAPENISFSAPVIVGSVAHEQLLHDHLAECGMADATLLLEPIGRNTAAAIALAAHFVAQTSPDAMLLILPTDHFIGDTSAFYCAVRKGILSANNGKIITFGIAPTHAETGYGYIQKGNPLDDRGSYAIERFIEKPDLAHAERLLNNDKALWNAGIFMAAASTLLQELHRYQPQIFSCADASLVHAHIQNNAIYPDAAHYTQCPAFPFDRAVMEKTSLGAVVPTSCGWSDLGSWEALHAHAKKDRHGNASVGHVSFEQCQNNYAYSSAQKINIIGLDNVIAIADRDAVLIKNKNGLTPSTVSKPWGHYTVFINEPYYRVKQLVLDPYSATSLQMHANREEQWIVVAGTAHIICDGTEQTLQTGDTAHIPCGSIHRLENDSSMPLVVIEIQIGNYLCENDILRIEDNYGREMD